MTDAQDITEVEWQFDAANVDDVAAWLESTEFEGFTVTPLATKNLADLYLDSADWRLNRARFTCRVRAKGKEYELTMKSMSGATGGMRRRREMTERFDPESIPEATLSMGAMLALGQCGNAIRLICGSRPLRDLFTISTNRRTYRLADDSGSLAEIAVDRTTVSGSDETLERVEIEVEANEEKVAAFVDQFSSGAALLPAGVSKFEFALAATGLQPPVFPPNFGPNIVTEDMTAAQAGYAIMRRQFGIFLVNEPGTRWGDDIEALHDMRVATRRLRAAMSAFREYLPAITERHRMELGWVAAVLGVVRDLDVQLERMDEWRAGLSESQASALDGIEAILRTRRDLARRRMIRALDSRRYERFVERFSKFLEFGPPKTFGPGKLPITQVAPRIAGKRYRQFRKLGDPINPASPAAEYHTLRIAGKKLRYALEFVSPVYGTTLLDFSRNVTAIQDILGLHQDADVAIDMLEAMARSDGRRLAPETLMAMGAISERYRSHAVELRAQVPAAYAALGDKSWNRVRKAMKAKV